MENTKPYVCCFGEVLWDILPSQRVPGGAPMNVAIHLQNLGVTSVMISKVGNDSLGVELKSFLKSRQCTTDCIQIDSKFPTGTVVADTSNPKEVKYDIIENVAWDHIDFTNSIEEKIENAVALVYGTLSCRNEHSRKTLQVIIHKTKALKIFDVNFRAPYYSKDLVAELIQTADVVKMNQDELEIINGWFGSPDFSFEEKIKNLKSHFKLKKILVTLGGDGASLTDDSGIIYSKVYKVEVKDTIGSGDSFLAAVIKNMLLKTSNKEMLAYACALGSIVASHHGANPEIKEDEIYSLMRSPTSPQ